MTVAARGTGRSRQRLGRDRGGRRQVKTDLGGEGGTVSGRSIPRGAQRAGGRTVTPLTCRPLLRLPPRRPFRCFGLSGSGLGLRLKSKPGSGSGARGSGARGSGGGPGASRASSLPMESNADVPKPIILVYRLGVQGRGGASFLPPSGAGLPRPETVSPSPMEEASPPRHSIGAPERHSQRSALRLPDALPPSQANSAFKAGVRAAGSQVL